eukprot:GFYU01007339.1.p1 GENE.GFYU01007339.1~~GFYU01007339.1.p1  ORF type:complete len:509 (-),score=132.53 GFYU01007339.1:252-1778(-)
MPSVVLASSESDVSGSHDYHKLEASAFEFENNDVEMLAGKDDNFDGYKPIVGYAFTLNFVIGAGVLGIPFAFAKAGVVLAGLFLVIITIVMGITMSWLIEVNGRAEAITALEKNGGLSGRITAPEYEITTRKYGVGQWCTIFLGATGGKIYDSSLFIFSIGAMWLYAVVFASSMTTIVKIPGVTADVECNMSSMDVPAECEQGYMIFAVLFAVVMMPMMLLELSDQIRYQMFLTAFCCLNIAIMIGTVLFGMFHNPFHVGGAFNAPYIEPAKFVDLSGFGNIFTAAIFAQVAHHGTPALVQLVKEKTKARSVFMSAFLTTAILYCFLGTVSALYFGDDVPAVITLNWKYYSGGVARAFESSPAWASLISYIVLLFPVMSVSSAFPLFGITLGQSLYPQLSQSTIDRFGARHTLIFCRMLACVVPLILGIVYRNAASITSVTGLAGFVVTQFIPGLLQLMSRRRCREIWGEDHVKTPYSWVFSAEVYVYGLMAFSGVCFVYTLYTLVSA